MLAVVGSIFLVRSRSQDSGIVEQPKNVILSRDLGLTDQEKQASNERISVLENKLKAANKEEEKYTLELQLGFEYFAIGEYSKSRSHHLEASKIMPQNPTPYAELYVVESSMGDYENAKRHIQKAIELNPSNAQYWKWIITLRTDIFKDSPDEIKNYYIDALAKTNSHVDILTAYAQFLEKQGDVVSAVAQWKKAKEINPEQSTIYDTEITRIQNMLK